MIGLGFLPLPHHRAPVAFPLLCAKDLRSYSMCAHVHDLPIFVVAYQQSVPLPVTVIALNRGQQHTVHPPGPWIPPLSEIQQVQGQMLFKRVPLGPGVVA